MSIFVPNKVYLRGILLHYFIQKKSAAEAHRILVQTYGDNALSDTTCRDWVNLSRELLLQRQKRKGFFASHRIVTGDEKWIHYDNPKRRKSWGKPGHASTSLFRTKEYRYSRLAAKFS
ncbi:MOS1T transposase, partial [Pseudoatta argentina]